MSKFEKLLKEALADLVGSAAAGIGKVASGVEQAVNVAAQQATGGGSLASLASGSLDFFKKFKFELKPVTNQTALKTADGKQIEQEDPETIGKMAKLGLVNVYTSSAVILSPDQGISVNGIYGRTVNHTKDKVMAAFRSLYILNANAEPTFINNTNNSNRFWIQLTGASDQYITSSYSPEEGDIIQEQQEPTKKILPKNNRAYTTWCIYKGPNAGLFEITEGSALPKYGLIKGDQRVQDQRNRQEPSYAFKLEGECARLLMVGNKTLYPKWYFLNDYEYSLNKKKIDSKEPESASPQAPTLYQKPTPAPATSTPAPATPAPAPITPNF
jgi:hypothetical protein